MAPVGRTGFGRLFTFILSALAATFIGSAGIWIIDWGYEKVMSPSPSIKIDFQAELRCPNGKLTDIRRLFEDDRVALTNGADRLTICDSEALTTTRSKIPRDLSRRYPGCVHADDREIIMLRASSAVCELPDSSGFICDGENGRTYPGSGAMGIGQPVAPCQASLLRRFGFAS